MGFTPNGDKTVRFTKYLVSGVDTTLSRTIY